MSNEEKIVNYPNSIDTRVALLEASISTFNQTLMRLESKIDKSRDELKQDINVVRQELKGVREELKKEVQYNFRWLFTIIGTLSAIMAHGFHWF